MFCELARLEIISEGRKDGITKKEEYGFATRISHIQSKLKSEEKRGSMYMYVPSFHLTLFVFVTCFPQYCVLMLGLTRQGFVSIYSESVSSYM